MDKDYRRKQLVLPSAKTHPQLDATSISKKDASLTQNSTTMQDDDKHQTQVEDESTDEACHTWRGVEFIKLPLDGSIDNDDIASDVVIGVVDVDFPMRPKTIIDSFSDKGIVDLQRPWKGKKNVKDLELNKKLIGAKLYNNTKGAKTWEKVDVHNHGSICATIAGGNYIQGDYFGIRQGTQRGSSPKSKVALYQCIRAGNGHMDGRSLFRAILGAVKDEVDILSVSLGSEVQTEKAYTLSSSARGCLLAALEGILCCNAAGNYGGIGQISNVDPWLLTVGACNTNKVFYTKVSLGNDQSIRGHSTNLFDKTGPCPLIYIDDGCKDVPESNRDPHILDPAKVGGKIIFKYTGTKDRGIDGKTIKEAGAKGVIFQSENDLYCDTVRYDLPCAILNSKEMKKLISYWESNKDECVAEIFPTQEYDENVGDYPVLYDFSAKGPNPKDLDIMKPDLCAPGQVVVPSSSVLTALDENDVKHSSLFCIVHGTSSAAALVAGAMAVLKGVHPTFSAAALKSAAMTTADPIIIDGKGKKDILGVGSGVLNVDKARHPGLVYDMDCIDYLHYLRRMGYDYEPLLSVDSRFKDLLNRAKTEKKDIHSRNLNLPNICAVFKEDEKKWTFKRSLKNVGTSNSVYSCHVVNVPGLEIVCRPNVLEFKELDDIRDYEIDVEVLDWEQVENYGFRTYLEWHYNNYRVRSYVLIIRSSTIEPIKLSI